MIKRSRHMRLVFRHGALLLGECQRCHTTEQQDLNPATQFSWLHGIVSFKCLGADWQLRTGIGYQSSRRATTKVQTTGEGVSLIQPANICSASSRSTSLTMAMPLMLLA